jgi:transforming growth factor-beta-induced protein
MKLFSNFAFILVGLLSFFPLAAARESILDIAQKKGFSILVTALEIAQLDGVLDCYRFCRLYTVFAPTDEAFALLPTPLVQQLTTDKAYSEHLKQLLLYHLVSGRVYSSMIQNGAIIATRQGETVVATKSGRSVTINGNARVVLGNLRASNGAVHAIDKVLVPSFLTNDLVDVAVSSANFKTLVAAVVAVDGLAEVLKGGTFTIFAPDDAAFAKLGTATINGLLADPNRLAEILKYHVVPGIVTAQDLKDGKVTTVQGGTIDVAVGNRLRSTTLNGDVTVTATNILASNGVIHVIVSADMEGSQTCEFF